MIDYIKEERTVKSIQNKNFARYSLSPRDYRTLNIQNPNLKFLSDFVIKHFVGKEIGAEAYARIKTKYRFLKTSNIQSSCLLDDSSTEYMFPCGKKGCYPQKNDILIAKDGNGDGLGEACLYTFDNIDHHDMISSGIHCLRIDEKYLFYVLAFIKSKYFKAYFDLNTAQGSTIRHGKDISLKFQIPFPNQKNRESIEKYVSLLMQDIIDKEMQINKKNNQIDALISGELSKTQKESNYVWKYPHKEDILNEGRLDTGLYCQKYKQIEHLVRNYLYGAESLLSKYTYKRGQNLQISQIGLSIYSKEQKNNFYRLLTNTELKDNRTISCFRYLGNANKLDVIGTNIVLLSADGTIGRSIFVDSLNNTITNIHMWLLSKIKGNNENIYENIFLSCYLSWLRNNGFFEYIKDKANGGGIKENHLKKYIFVPNFPDEIQKKISSLYYSLVPKNKNISLDDYLENTRRRNDRLGIFQLNLELFDLNNNTHFPILK